MNGNSENLINRSLVPRDDIYVSDYPILNFRLSTFTDFASTKNFLSVKVNSNLPKISKS